MQEIWKPVPYEGYDEIYRVSNLGRFKVVKKSAYSRSKSDYLKWGWEARGRYACVTLYNNGLRRQVRVHRTVADAFLPPAPKGKNLVRHLDGDTKNNTLDNLAWGDNTDNMRDMVRHGNSTKGEKNVKAKLTAEQVLEIRRLYKEEGKTQMDLASLYGIDQTSISKIVLRINWKYLD